MHELFLKSVFYAVCKETNDKQGYNDLQKKTLKVSDKESFA